MSDKFEIPGFARVSVQEAKVVGDSLLIRVDVEMDRDALREAAYAWLVHMLMEAAS